MKKPYTHYYENIVVSKSSGVKKKLKDRASEMGMSLTEVIEYLLSPKNSIFLYEGNEYPNILSSEDGYESFETLIPEPSGDYFLAVIDSLGEYKLIEFIPKEQVTISYR